jgi:3',5'-cyclic AMP phosphodiesterase CpdA
MDGAMRIALTSDLHVEHHPEVIPLVVARVRELAVDALVVAGDLTPNLETLGAALATLATAAPRTLFIPGNHDLWCTAAGPDSRARFEREIPARCAAAGVDALGAGGPVDVGGVVFVGVTGWYDYSLRSHSLDGTFSIADYRKGAWGRLRWNDKTHVTWPDDAGALLDDEQICAAQVALLERQLDEAGERPTVVVTHHLGFSELVTERGELPWDFINGFMGSARLGEAMQRGRGVRAAFCGHTHFRRQTRVQGVAGEFAVEASPVGYPREYVRYGGVTLPERVLDRVLLVDLAV